MSSTASPYTNPTGDGYVGTHTARHNRLSLALGTSPVFEAGDVIAVFKDGPGRVRLVHGDSQFAASHPEDRIESRTVNRRSQAEFTMSVAKALGVTDRADVRIYDREDSPGYVIVRADDDPFLPGET